MHLKVSALPSRAMALFNGAANSAATSSDQPPTHPDSVMLASTGTVRARVRAPVTRA